MAASLIPENPNIMSEEARLAKELEEAFQEPALPRHEQMDRRVVPGQPYVPFGNKSAPQPEFNFDPKVLMLLMECATTKAQKQLIDKLWKDAQKLSEDYDIVYEPALKKRNVSEN